MEYKEINYNGEKINVVIKINDDMKDYDTFLDEENIISPDSSSETLNE